MVDEKQIQLTIPEKGCRKTRTTIRQMKKMNPEKAKEIAIAGLQFIAGDMEQLSRFVSLTGMGPDQMRDAAATPAFLEAVLDFFMGDEPTLLSFAASACIEPQDIPSAKLALSTNDHAAFEP